MIDKRIKSLPGVRNILKRGISGRIVGMVTKRNIAVVIACIILILAIACMIIMPNDGGNDSIMITAVANGTDTDNISVLIDLNVDYDRGNGDQKPCISVNVMGAVADDDDPANEM